jgi:tRNA 2-selenouridine synthase
MVSNRIRIDEFIGFSVKYPVLDVRSPAEYVHAHIPGAYNLSLFSDEERKVVGTAYKQKGRQEAIKIGLDYFGVKMSKMVEEAEKIVQNHRPGSPNSNTVLVHCWRGGMRSAGVAWLLDLYGFNVYTLTGGYKSFRNWAWQQFLKPYNFSIIGGYTGSGKTRVLKELAGAKETVIDLEGIAHHKGSAFGDLGQEKQPTQEMFENKLALQLGFMPDNEHIWLEDESRRIGNINLPLEFWATMRRSPVFFLDIPFEERLNYITEEYGKFRNEELINATVRIRKRLGGLNAKNAVNYLLENNCREAFRILLSYYDKYYNNGLHERGNLKELLTTIPCTLVDAKMNSKLVAGKKQITDGITNSGG